MVVRSYKFLFKLVRLHRDLTSFFLRKRARSCKILQELPKFDASSYQVLTRNLKQELVRSYMILQDLNKFFDQGKIKIEA